MYSSTCTQDSQMILRQWFGRAIHGFVWACIWSSLVAFGWVSNAVTTHGSLDKAIDAMKLKPSTLIWLGAYLATAPASFLGGWLGPMLLGKSSLREPVIQSSAFGAAIATFLALILGVAAGWTASTFSSPPQLFVHESLGLGTLAGVCGGISAATILRQKTNPIH